MHVDINTDIDIHVYGIALLRCCLLEQEVMFATEFEGDTDLHSDCTRNSFSLFLSYCVTVLVQCNGLYSSKYM